MDSAEPDLDSPQARRYARRVLLLLLGVAALVLVVVCTTDHRRRRTAEAAAQRLADELRGALGKHDGEFLRLRAAVQEVEQGPAGRRFHWITDSEPPLLNGAPIVAYSDEVDRLIAPAGRSVLIVSGQELRADWVDSVTFERLFGGRGAAGSADP